MGSAYSGLTKFGGYIQQYDWVTLAKGIAGKQQQYDVNYNAIQQKIDEIANLDLRPVDKQYLYNRLKETIERVNNSGTLDLSKQGVSKQLNHDVVSAIDEKVLNGVAGMLSVKKYYKEVEFIKQKKPEQYNIYNDLYAQEKINKWYSNPNPGATFGGAEYIPYVDYKGKIVETLNKIKNLGDEAVIEVPTGDGYIVRKKVKELSPMDVRSIVTSKLSAAELKQMEIDGWAKYRAYDDKTLANIAEMRIKNKLAQYKGQLSHIDNKLANKNLSNAERELLLQEKANITQSAIATANEFKELQNIVSANPTAARQRIYQYLEHEDTVDYAVGLYARKNTEVIYKADDAYWKYIDYKYKYDALSKKCCKSSKGDGDDADDLNSGGDFLYVPLSTEVPEEDVNPFDKLSKEFVQTKAETNALGSDIIKSFDIEESDALINKIKTDYNLDDIEAQWRIIQEQTNYGTDFSKVDAKRYFAFRDRYFDYETKKGTLDSIYNEVIKESLPDVKNKIVESLPDSLKRKYGIKSFDDIKNLDDEKKKGIYFSIVYAFKQAGKDKDVAILMNRAIGEELFGDRLGQVNNEYSEFIKKNPADENGRLLNTISNVFTTAGIVTGFPGFTQIGMVTQATKGIVSNIYSTTTMKLGRSMDGVVEDLDKQIREKSGKYAKNMPQDMAVSITDPELKGAIVAMAQAGKLITVEGKNLGGNLDKDGQINVYNKIITGNPKNILVTVTKGSSAGLKRVVLSNGSATAVVELPDSAFSNPNNNMVNSKLTQLVGKIDSGDYSPHRPWHLRASAGSFLDVDSADDRDFAMITQTAFGGNKEKAQIITDTGAKRFLLMAGAPLTQFYYNNGKLYSQQQAIDPATNKVKDGFVPVQDILQKLPDLSKNIVVDLKSDPQVGDVVVNYYYDNNGDGMITPEDTNIVSFRVDGGTAQKYVENLKRSPQLLALDLFGKVLQRQAMSTQQYVGTGGVESGIPVDKRFGLLVEKLNL